jgi:hypothetical protein
VLLIAVTNAVVLAGAARNRRGDPEATLTLTERELPLGFVQEENSGIWLRLEWRPRAWDGSPGWFGIDKLQAVGFDCSLPPGDPTAEMRYGKMLPLERYAVLEYEGEAWRAWLAGEEKEDAGQLEEFRRRAERQSPGGPTVEEKKRMQEAERLAASRLFIVDVRKDPADLRRRYPDRSRYIVSSALVRLALRAWNPVTRKRCDPFLQGYVSEILIDTIHVPRAHRALLDAVRQEEKRASEEAERKTGGLDFPRARRSRGPRFQVTLKYGRRLEPWIAEVRPLDAAERTAP